jgi:hypothetical protein
LMGWLDPTSGRTVLRADPFFAYLESRNVSFFDLGITPPAPKRHKMSPLDIRDGGAGWTTTSV